MVDHAQAEVEVLPELAGLDPLLQVGVGRRQHAHVDRTQPVVAEAARRALLEHAQQLHLRLRRHLADLVEQQRAAVAVLELALAVGDGAGERALHVPC